jgi:hypothetical protein
MNDYAWCKQSVKLTLGSAILVLSACASIHPDHVKVTGRGLDANALDRSCADFNLTNREAATFLRRASVITAREVHDYFDYAPCFVTGSASFLGKPVTWVIRAGGSGYLESIDGALFDSVKPPAEILLLGDPSMKINSSEN